jgi:hypothetical protein
VDGGRGNRSEPPAPVLIQCPPVAGRGAVFLVRCASPFLVPTRGFEALRQSGTIFSPPDGQHKEWWQRLKSALGTASSDFVNASLFQLISAARLPRSGSEIAVNATLAFIEGAKPGRKSNVPGDPMACTHTAAMAVLERIGGGHGTDRNVALMATTAVGCALARSRPAPPSYTTSGDATLVAVERKLLVRLYHPDLHGFSDYCVVCVAGCVAKRGCPETIVPAPAGTCRAGQRWINGRGRATPSRATRQPACRVAPAPAGVPGAAPVFALCGREFTV